ncbi:MAG: NADH-quinone oxidoreductase subunit H [Burkholderiaceae bacterium]
MMIAAILTATASATLLGLLALAAMRLDRRIVDGATAAGLSLGTEWHAQRLATERADTLLWHAGNAGVAATALFGLLLLPVNGGKAVLPSEVGIVLWGSCEAAIVLLVFLHGWSPNAWFALLGAYRMVGIGLPVLLPSMFVLIGAALPARSLDFVAIVAAQQDGWNALRQPLSLPLLLPVALLLSKQGAFAAADSAELAGGTIGEDSGPRLTVSRLARHAVLVAYGAMIVTVCLGGGLGPWLAPPAWFLLKTICVSASLVVLGHLVALPTPARMLSLLWLVVLPLSFVHLAQAGAAALDGAAW